MARGGMKIREGDDVIILAGKDRGQTGTVLRTEPDRKRVFVEGRNLQKRHSRPRSIKDNQTDAGGIIEVEGPIHISNVAILDPTDNKPTRIGIERADGERHRVSKRTGTRLD
jgi:large subunit ribosomal protein L24